jgi:hypothetical protein
MTTRVQKKSSKPALLSILTWVKKKERKKNKNPQLGLLTQNPQSCIHNCWFACFAHPSRTFLSPSSHALACIPIFFFFIIFFSSSVLLPVQIINYSTRTSHAP